MVFEGKFIDDLAQPDDAFDLHSFPSCGNHTVLRQLVAGYFTTSDDSGGHEDSARLSSSLF
jgi:hypothetical protein